MKLRYVKIICDKCGKEMHDGDSMYHSDTRDICIECLETIVEQWFSTQNTLGTAKPEKTETDEKNSDEKIQPEKKKKYDFGKAQSLRDANWDLPRIAKEVGCTQQEVLDNTTKPKERKPKPFEWEGNSVKNGSNLSDSEMRELMRNNS